MYQYFLRVAYLVCGEHIFDVLKQFLPLLWIATLTWQVKLIFQWSLEQGWAIMFTQRAAFLKILKTFEAEDRTDW